ncbi:ribonuclease H [Oceanobacillus alkalisoli]|uniref:ribonuclease H n=1 Tax=Oceanobacillus alkalisoli TaxID=2925113 RepID=UPI001EE4DFD4|nr:ribonuclease H family protein [Oceanobacillus alkalisoli]MCG5105097.1 ribonuclease H family protein [Oceanobacillus alkalisoli]
MAKQKYYVVWEGRNPGIYTSWADCQKQTSGYKQAKFKSYPSLAEAEKAYKAGWKNNWGSGGNASAMQRKKPAGNISANSPEEKIDYDSISVDVGTRGNPGPIEYQAVDTRTGEVVFSYGPIKKGTNNLGEFLAIVHALAFLQKQGSEKTIYTDSVNAMKWVREKKVSTTLKRDASTEEIWNLIDRALEWLHTHTYENKIKKWDTKKWGEIKADYGRK